MEMTELGRPGRSSGAGFMAQDEDVLSVLRGDNHLVSQLGLTHTKMARPLFPCLEYDAAGHRTESHGALLGSCGTV